MIWGLLGILIGATLGLLLPFQIPFIYSRYVSCAFLAALDSTLGAGRAHMEKKLHLLTFITGFISNTLLAGLLTYMGDRMGVDLYFAAVITFGMRIFTNLTFIRKDLLAAKLHQKPDVFPDSERNLTQLEELG